MIRSKIIHLTIFPTKRSILVMFQHSYKCTHVTISRWVEGVCVCGVGGGNSSVVLCLRLSEQIWVCLTSKTNTFVPHISFRAREKLLPLLFSVRLFLFCWLVFACEVFLCAQNLSVKKKVNKQTQNCPANLKYSTTTQKCFVKKMFLETSQSLQEKT